MVCIPTSGFKMAEQSGDDLPVYNLPVYNSKVIETGKLAG